MRATLVLTLALFASLEASSDDLDWWKHANMYQIYPRSFKDSNNDGIGDIQGIIQKIEHFNTSYIDAIWLSPIFKSPQLDQGYDISDYRKVDPSYGTMADLKQLIQEAHQRGIKLILDFVPNHTSDQHEWFLNSVKKVDGYSDFYVWRNGTIDENGERQPPNNWNSLFKNSTWTWNEERQQYYLHQFLPQQPDLNFRNPKVLQAMNDILIFWLDNDVDGFRIDAVPYLFEDELFRDQPRSNNTDAKPNDYEYYDHIYTKDQPETFEVIYQWRELVDNYTNQHGGAQRVLMTEVYTDINNTMLYYGTPDGSRLGAHFTFNFNLITDIKMNFTAYDLAESINKWLDNIPEIYTSNWVLGNHDNNRVATRLGPISGMYLNTLKAVLPGVSIVYNGEEIGQEDGEVSFDERQDPKANDPATFDEDSRDFERTPFQWDNTTNAGFNEGAKPWLPVSKKYLETNLEEEKLSVSVYSQFRESSSWKRHFPVLSDGKVTIEVLADYVIKVHRFYEDGKNLQDAQLFVNFGDEPISVEVGGDDVVVFDSPNNSKSPEHLETLFAYSTKFIVYHP